MPLLTTTTTTARNLYTLLRTLSFSPKAHVYITSTGLRFSVDDARTMQGLAFLGKELFTHYHYDATTLAHSHSQSHDPDSDTAPIFQISLPALLETLQIFGSLDQTPTSASYSANNTSTIANTSLATAFDTRVLGMPSACRISYDGPGSPLTIALEEANVRTHCALTAYEPDLTDDIPFDRAAVVAKIIMRATWLHDAVNELAVLAPERVSVAVGAPHTESDPGANTALSLVATGAHGSATVSYERDAPVLETYQCAARVRHSYKFAHLRQAARAMGGAAAAKASLRVDAQGVLSCQLMVTIEGGDGFGFVEFRLVPFVEEDF